MTVVRRHVVHDLGQRRARAACRAPSCSPILKPTLPASVRMAWPGSYMPAPIGDHAAERALAPGHRRHALVVDAVLEIDHDAVGPGQVGERRARSPTRCRRTSRPGRPRRTASHALQLVQVERLAPGSAWSPQVPDSRRPSRLHRLHVLGPLVDQRHVVPGPREQPADHAADRPRADDPDSHAHGREPTRAPGVLTSRPTAGRRAPRNPVALDSRARVTQNPRRTYRSSRPGEPSPADSLGCPAIDAALAGGRWSRSPACRAVRAARPAWSRVRSIGPVALPAVASARSRRRAGRRQCLRGVAGPNRPRHAGFDSEERE